MKLKILLSVVRPAVLVCLVVSAKVYAACPLLPNMVAPKSGFISAEKIIAPKTNASVQDWINLLGPAARDIGSGSHVLEWDVSDGRVFRIGFIDVCQNPLYTRFEKPLSSPQNFLATTSASPAASVEVSLFKNKYLSDVSALELTSEEHDWYEVAVKSILSDVEFEQSQYLVIADRNPVRQVGSVAYWDATTKRLNIFGWSPISTGSRRKGHFITPVGLFQNKPEHPSYRALGTPNENGIRGIGSKGMRVFDFGWVPSVRGWGQGDPQDIRFQMHATDPYFLEQRLGVPDSQGCVRIISALNKFIDHHGVLDKLYETSPRGWILAKDRETIVGAGSFLAVVDSSHSGLSALRVPMVTTKIKKS